MLEAATGHPELSDFVLSDRTEPFSVTTIEQSVAQSRDRVIFSIGYGRTPHGRVLSDFGALGREGGERLLAVATLLKQVHCGVLRLGQRGHAAPLSRDAQVGQALFALQARVPALSPREAAVCARIACGTSADGIAAELGIAPSTVLTLRKRAYAKLAQAGFSGGRLQLSRLAA